MAKKQFKTESKKLMDLMINSIYTNKDIFLREIISNASDAIDKLYYKSLTDRKIKVNKDDLCIKIATDEDAKTITIVFTDETEVTGELVGTDEISDIAVVKVPKDSIKAVCEIVLQD